MKVDCTRDKWFFCATVFLVMVLHIGASTGESIPEENMDDKISGNLRKQIIGTWKLVSIEGTGFTIERLGNKPVGLLTYDKSGYVTAQIMRSDRSRFAVGEIQAGTPDEIKAAFQGYVAYFGTYTVDESEGSVTHQVVANLFPNEIGRSFKRYCDFSGNKMILRVNSMFGGEQLRATLVWERVH